MDELSEKVETLQNLLVAHATGTKENDREYQLLRQEIFSIENLKQVIPRFVRTCRNLQQFWAYIKKFQTYQERREHIWSAFRPIFDELEGISSSSQTQETPQEYTENHDAFICHASEDKESLARPLAEILKEKGFHIWYDEFTLNVGDSLRQSIDKGLKNSKFAIVILSKNFFSKNWPQYELNGLTAREISGQKVILPIWHQIEREDVMKYSPTLADKVALNSTKSTVEELAESIADILRPNQSLDPHTAIQTASGGDFSSGLSLIASILIQVIIFGEEFEKRSINPWLDEIRSNFGSLAEELGELILDDNVINDQISLPLDNLRDLLEKIAYYRLAGGEAWDKFNDLMNQALSKAIAIKTEWIDSIPLSKGSLIEIRSTIIKSSKKLNRISKTAGSMDRQGRMDELQEKVSEIGNTLLQVGYYNLDSFKKGLHNQITLIGHEAHLIEIERIYMDGGKSVNTIIEKIQSLNNSLQRLASSIE
ncbi:MAG: toll/interleukin-1 receptor domain-containing protein [Nitrospinae bacterium]|nr:toll/interleukin-1 receptor domain-containing protein [Nitrospinota bacterium]